LWQNPGVREVLDIEQSFSEIQWSPTDEQYMAVRTYAAAYLVDMESGHTTPLASDAVDDLVWSPDGHYLKISQHGIGTAVINVYTGARFLVEDPCLYPALYASPCPVYGEVCQFVYEPECQDSPYVGGDDNLNLATISVPVRATYPIFP
jgi:hypothetical protein